jgi:hypothetical protein
LHVRILTVYCGVFHLGRIDRCPMKT